jgi:KDO2-lipid IV(A) lauroyltransferase
MADQEGAFARRLGHAAQAALLALFLVLCRALPVDGASALGGWIGRTVGPRMGQSRKAARNLARAMPANSADENRRIIRGMWDNLGRVVAEYPHLPRICAKLEGGRLEIAGLDILRALIDDGKPGVMFGAHLGNWEVLPYSARHTGLELAFIYRAPNNPLVDAMLRRLRNTPRQFRKGREGARELFTFLKRGGHGAMLVDQKMNDGIPVPFFGRDAMTAPAIAQFALRLGAVLVPVRTERLNGARFRITIFPPLAVQRTADRALDELTVMADINCLIQQWIGDRPEQWLWLHRRWPD